MAAPAFLPRAGGTLRRRAIVPAVRSPVHAVTELAGWLSPHEQLALLLAVVACAFDLRTRHLPNALTFGGAAAGFAFGLYAAGVSGLLVSLGGWATGLAVFLPFFILGGLGAGDVKLMACLGAWLGAADTVWVALYAAVAGGVLALLMAVGTGYLRAAVDNTYLLLTHFRVAGVRPHPELTLERGKGPRLPYALPITAGMLLTLWLR